jgi:predicted TIM-barrel fold metal-dependent hydrolase
MLTRREVLMGAAAAAASAWRVGAEQRGPGVSFLMPPGATDCHAHIFGDPKVFPMAAARTYTPEPAPVSELLALHRSLHIERVVFVQPSVYGTDNDCMLAAIRQAGFRARGIAVIDETTTPGAIDALFRAGVRGVRINLETAGHSDPAQARARFEAAARQVASHRLHVQMFTRPSVIAAIRDVIEASPVTVVFDHFGGAQASGGVTQPGFVALVASGKAYVKLSAPYRGSTDGPSYADMAPLAKALFAANPRRVLWGSDWPHPDTSPDSRNADTGTWPRLAVDDVTVLNQLAAWVPSMPQRRLVLVENPARLYGW